MSFGGIISTAGALLEGQGNIQKFFEVEVLIFFMNEKIYEEEVWILFFKKR